VKADLICVMEKGEIIERGSHSDLLSINGRYAKLWEQQTKFRESKEFSRS
jgi:ABC-type multidrug transport system fused ATPase/permease subunit